jgi:hypothetical protein
MSKGTSNNAEHEYEQEKEQYCQVGTSSMNDAISHSQAQRGDKTKQKWRKKKGRKEKRKEQQQCK